MIDHLGLEVRDYLRSKDFYLAALAPLGIELLMEFEGRIGGFGRAFELDHQVAQRPGQGSDKYK